MVEAAGCVEQSFSCSTTLSTSYSLSSHLDVRSSNAWTWAASLAGVAAGIARVGLEVVVVVVLALSSAAAIRSTKLSTSFSKCPILACCFLWTSWWSRISCYSYVISSAISRCLDVMSVVFASCSSLTSTAVSPSYCTFSSKLLPAVWTVLMEASASFFHASS